MLTSCAAEGQDPDRVSGSVRAVGAHCKRSRGAPAGHALDLRDHRLRRSPRRQWRRGHRDCNRQSVRPDVDGSPHAAIRCDVRVGLIRRSHGNKSGDPGPATNPKRSRRRSRPLEVKRRRAGDPLGGHDRRPAGAPADRRRGRSRSAPVGSRRPPAPYGCGHS